MFGASLPLAISSISTFVTAVWPSWLDLLHLAGWMALVVVVALVLGAAWCLLDLLGDRIAGDIS